MLFVGAEDAFRFAEYFFEACAHVVAEAGVARRYVLWQETQVSEGFEHTSFHEVVVWEARFGTTQARVVGAGFGRLAVPQNAVTTSAGHWSAATYFIKQATAAFAEAAVYFFGKTDGIWTARLNEIGEECFWAVEFVQ